MAGRLTVIDEWTREYLAIDVAGGIRSVRVIEVHPARERPWRAPASALRQRVTSEVKETELLRSDSESAENPDADRQAVSTVAE